MTIMGSLQVSIAIVNALRRGKLNFQSHVKNWPKISIFGRKWGRNIKFCFRGPLRHAHPCAKRRIDRTNTVHGTNNK